MEPVQPDPVPAESRPPSWGRRAPAPPGGRHLRRASAAGVLGAVVALLAASLLSSPAVAAKTAGSCAAEGRTLNAAKAAYERSCTQPREDCDPVAGRWTCSSRRLGDASPAQPSPPEPVRPTPANRKPAPRPASPGGSNVSGAVPGSSAFDPGSDLLSLHHDNAPDRDDGHATVANRTVTGALGITPHVVSGTYGTNSGSYVPASEAVMRAAWGSAWLNAHSNWSGAVAATARRWSAVLATGGDIWVAEGGQSDFTADVIRAVKQRDPGLDTKKRIHVVQHSSWNERKTTASDLSYVRSATDYTKIDDGNDTNRTADLNRTAASSNSKNDAFVTAARGGRFGSAWAAAFRYYSPQVKLDFSDSVELLYILGIGKDRVATVDDFADEFLR